MCVIFFILARAEVVHMKYYANLLDKILELEEELKSNQLWWHLVNSEDVCVYSSVQIHPDVQKPSI